MKKTYTVSLEADAETKESDITALIVGLTEFNAIQAGGELPRYLLATARNSEGILSGGLFGATYLGWLQVQAVWLSDTLRGQGFGRDLMKIAEEEAVRRGCMRAFLETYSFQALPFYERCGYQIFSRLSDFPIGGARYALTKDLSALI